MTARSEEFPLGQKLTLPGHFAVPVVLEAVRKLGQGYECRVANTKDGWIVVGVTEAASGFAWGGLTDDQCKAFETSRLNRFLQNYADPPINTHVIKHTSQGNNFVVIEIPRFPDTPHICQKDSQARSRLPRCDTSF